MSNSEEEVEIKTMYIRRKSYYARFHDAEGSPFLKSAEIEKKNQEMESEKTAGKPSYRGHLRSRRREKIKK